jgi:flagellar hook protein FlgE
MGLSRSLSTGTSSLRAHQKKFDVIANNLANASTVGYKANRVTFADQFSQTTTLGQKPDSSGDTTGGLNPVQFGLGVKVGAVQRNMDQGLIEVTGRALDMAINGNGFFIYQADGQTKYSRAGAVVRDSNGYLVDAGSGSHLQGYNLVYDRTGKPVKDGEGNNILDRKLSNLRIQPGFLSTPRQTTEISLNGNLNAQMATGETRSTSINIFDKTGAPREIALVFEKTATPNEYTITGSIEGNSITLSDTTVTFNEDGSINTPTQISVTAAELNTVLGGDLFDEVTPKDINILFVDPDGNSFGGLTQFSSPSNATIQSQNGYEAGELLNMQVSPRGEIVGTFTNGQSEVIAQVAISKFTNPEGLITSGGNFFEASPNAGTPNIGTAGETFPSSTIAGSALEQSNVDLTIEFTEMISTQRAFEAASRTVTVGDQMLAEINQLKR